MKITFEIEGQPETVVTVPGIAVAAADAKAKALGYAGVTHLMCRYLLDNLLVGFILPDAPQSDGVKAEMDAIVANLTAKKAELEQKRLSAYLPTLRIGGVEITLPEIEASLAVAKAAAAAEAQAAKN